MSSKRETATHATIWEMLWGSQQSTLSYGAAMEYHYCCKLEISMNRQWLPCVNSMQMLLEKPFQVAMQKHVHNSTETPTFFWAALRMTMHRDANTFWASGTLQAHRQVSWQPFCHNHIPRVRHTALCVKTARLSLQCPLQLCFPLAAPGKHVKNVCVCSDEARLEPSSLSL